MQHAPAPLSYNFLLRFWSPLAMTWFFMALEGPIIAAIIARMAEPKYNLAAYGLSFAFALVFEAPVIMLMTASTTLVRDRASYRKLLRFVRVLCCGVVVFNLCVLAPPIFSRLIGLMGLPLDVEGLTYDALLLLIPWPVAIGIRRFLQGVLVGQGQTRKIAVGTTIRLATMLGFACLGAFTQIFSQRAGSGLMLSGASIGALALSAGVVAEALVVYLMTRPYIAALPELPPALLASTMPGSLLTYAVIWNFYLPLALTSFVALAVQPLVTFFVGLCRLPLESLAVMPVINAFLFIFKSIGLSYQEMAIALGDGRYDCREKLRNFALGLAGIFSLLISVIALTPLSHFWFEELSGLPSQLADFARQPVCLLIPVPALTVMLCWLRSLAITCRKTSLVSYGTFIEVATIAAVMAYGAQVANLDGATAAAMAVTLGRCVCCAYYWLRREQLSASANEKRRIKLSTRST